MAPWERGNVEYTQLQKEPNEKKEKDATDNDRLPFYWNTTFSWLSNTLRVGFRRPLEQSDLPYSMGQEPTKQTAETFEMTWSRELEKSLRKNCPPNLWSTVIRSIGCWNLALVFFTATLAGACRIIQQLFLLNILMLMANGTSQSDLWLATSGLIISLCAEMVVKNQYFYIVAQILRTKVTSGLISLVYTKVSLNRFPGEMAKKTIKILNNRLNLHFKKYHAFFGKVYTTVQYYRIYKPRFSSILTGCVYILLRKGFSYLHSHCCYHTDKLIGVHFIW